MSLRGTGSNGNEEDAMFTKKPLGGVSCASCERGITNMSGLVVDYTPWKKLPFREPGERIAKVNKYHKNIIYNIIYSMDKAFQR